MGQTLAYAVKEKKVKVGPPCFRCNILLVWLSQNGNLICMGCGQEK